MPYLTKQEKIVLISFAIVLFVGTLLRLAHKQYPSFDHFLNMANTDIISKVDINRATSSQLEAIPYIGKYTAANIVEYRQAHGGFSSLEELQLVKGIRENNYKRFCRFLTSGPKEHDPR